MTLPLLDDVKLDGFPVEQLYPGWAPLNRAPVADDFSVVVFTEASTSRQACWWLEGYAPHTLLLPSGHADSGEALPCPNGRKIGANRITALLAAQRGNGPLIVSSPFTALPLLAQITFETGPLSVSRFQEADTVFYLIWNNVLPALRPSFYYPDAPLLISDDPGGAMIPGMILSWYARHPEHAALIREARPFRAEDFGVGQASGLRPKPSDENSPPPPAAPAPSPLPVEQPASATPPHASRQGLKSRLKSLFGRL
ncbi:hypothetical protein [Gluconobacter oxydans]|uniref:hypothetical protein n=1 Tax=Gluconobacter oxydans TaxID=442 RepID=UPI0003FF3EDB|nr:hypothetical protein [Gluconobacter oxydans]